MIILPEEKKMNQIYFLSGNSGLGIAEQTYLATRKDEGRIYGDTILSQLPKIGKEHKFYSEWRLREATMKYLIKYFTGYKNLEILDLGCGNCWLADKISTSTENFVYALDINRLELEQGAKVFSKNERLQFIFADIFEDILPQKAFDAVVIASSVQYFKELRILIKRLLTLLNVSGEILIIDSNFYKGNEIKAAKERTERYYNNLGHPEMIRFYHHHNWEELNEFNYRIVNKFSFKTLKRVNKIFRNNYAIFPRIRIKVRDNL
jgi:ubiquinone/menaquinone biosynthesis C-methylase UbiE